MGCNSNPQIHSFLISNNPVFQSGFLTTPQVLNDIRLHPDASKTSVLVRLDPGAALLGSLERWFGLSAIVLNLWGPVLACLLCLSCRWCWWLLKPLHQRPIWDASGKSPALDRWISRVVDESWTDLFSFVSSCLLIVFCLFSSRCFFPNVDSIFVWITRRELSSRCVFCCWLGFSVGFAYHLVEHFVLDWLT